MATVVRVDPYDKVTGLLMPWITQRMLEYAHSLTPELDAEAAVRNFLTPLYGGDPSTMLLAYVDEKGRVVGHCAARIEAAEDGTRLLVIRQCRADGNVGDAMQLAIDLLDQWGEAHEVKAMVMTTTRSDKAWERRAGFTEYRKIMVRPLGAKGAAEDA